MGLFKKLKKIGQSAIDVARLKKGVGTAIADTADEFLGKHNFISNIANAADARANEFANQFGGWDNLALMAGSLALGPAGAAAGLSVGGTIGAAASLGSAALFGYTGSQEHAAEKAQIKADRQAAAAQAEYEAQVAAAESEANRLRRAELQAQRAARGATLQANRIAGAASTTTELNPGNIILG